VIDRTNVRLLSPTSSNNEVSAFLLNVFRYRYCNAVPTIDRNSTFPKPLPTRIIPARDYSPLEAQVHNINHNINIITHNI